MSGNSFGIGACCPPAAEGITYLKIGARHVTVGLQGLETLFGQLYALGRQPDEASDEELLALARRRNYIRSNAEVEADYAAAIRKAYAAYHARQEKTRVQAE